MNENLIYSVALLPALLFYITSFIPNKKTKLLNSISNYINISSVILFVVFIISFSLQNFQSTNLFNIDKVGSVLRIDSLSLIMYGMVSIIAFFVLRYSKNYLSGDVNQSRFIKIFSFIIASVQILVLSGNIFLFFVAWVSTSFALQKLLVLNPNRKKAIKSAKLKFIFARISDLSLLGACIIFYNIFNTGDLNSIIHSDLTKFKPEPSLDWALFLLVISAIFKSVQFPFHSWLIGVLESPTPVSALLHAGLLNAGPFLIIRFSPVFVNNDITSTLLISIGAISALYGSISYTAQTNIKTGLVYSSVGHMGFSLMLCGFGLYSAALLHLVSHSFYKAYSFLNSGSTIYLLKNTNTSLYKRKGNALNFILALLASSLIFFGINYLIVSYFNFAPEFMFIGYAIFISLLSLHIFSLDSSNYLMVNAKVTLISILLLVSFYTLEELTSLWLGNEVLASKPMSLYNQVIVYGLLFLFLLTILFQAIVTTKITSKIGSKLRVHFKNGLYVNALYERLWK